MSGCHEDSHWMDQLGLSITVPGRARTERIVEKLWQPDFLPSLCNVRTSNQNQRGSRSHQPSGGQDEQDRGQYYPSQHQYCTRRAFSASRPLKNLCLGNMETRVAKYPDNSKPVLFVIIYLPPGTSSRFLSDFSDFYVILC